MGGLAGVLSSSSFLFKRFTVGTGLWEVGIPDMGTSAALSEGGGLEGLDGVGLLSADEGEGRRFGITVNEFLDCNRRFARACA